MLHLYKGRPVEVTELKRISKKNPDFQSLLGEFKELDSMIHSMPSCLEDAFWDDASKALSASELCGGLGNYSTLSEARSLPLGYLQKLLRKSDITPKELKVMNAKLTGANKASYRGDLVWFGNEHPADSFFVPPLPQSIQGLVKNALDFYQDKSVPVTMRAGVSLLQILMIHPFKDGNGRVARFLFLLMLAKKFGYKLCYTNVLQEIWKFRGTFLHDGQTSVTEHNDWQAYLSFFGNCIKSVKK